ncbi:polysaccharide deacetylase family protein [Pontibacter diazotrophicus]|uniref:Polysaccharide deacetylase family protein n=1 Tax=Pontibacter diazotrophicus TaxID=1400979 RepID=A0A3D8LGK8_9BACT|nr:polysaccharide deacetylase family protein [Pontibacter diazotrophicus]RDV16466.1 polysaccharide deacetylase family protein [Pontibacter diazotrophicus]
MNTRITRFLCASICSVTFFLAACDEIKTTAVSVATPPDTQTSSLPGTVLPAETKAVDPLPTIDLMADAKTVLDRPQVPILCYHQIRDWKPTDSRQAKDYIVPVARFEEHIKMLADSGYHTILPDQLVAYLTTGAPLPEKPVMLTFDDTNLDQFTVAAPELEKYGFKGVFFVMTVSLGRPRYMSRAQVKDLSDRGHSIGSHTWDHQNVKKLKSEDWITQVEKPSKVLEEIIGKPVTYFAYPFGLWNKEAITELQSLGITAAFQLANSLDEEKPLYTVRRNIASGYWGAETLHKKMVESYKLNEAPVDLPHRLALLPSAQ